MLGAVGATEDVTGVGLAEGAVVITFFRGGRSFFFATTIATTSALFIERPPGKTEFESKCSLNWTDKKSKSKTYTLSRFFGF